MRPRIYFSTQHLWGALRWTSEARRIEKERNGTTPLDLEHRAYVVNAIFSAAAFLEAAINELYQDAYDEHLAHIAPLSPAARESIAEFWKIIAGHDTRAGSRFGTHEKYWMALTLAGAEPLDTESDLYRNARLVIRLQNALVHYKPMTFTQIDTSGLDEELHGKFPLNPFTVDRAEAPFFPDKALGSGCAEWAVRSARAFAEAFFEELGIRPNYRSIETAA